jgi:pimeloyl-ACP methyl ester carboxylesterase
MVMAFCVSASVAWGFDPDALIPSLQIKIVKDAGHAAIYDQPEAVNELVLEFLRKE